MPDSAPLDPAELRFRALTQADLPLLHRWLNEPHARHWFHGGPSLADVVTEYSAYIEGREPIFAYLVSYGERPIGMMSWERAGDFRELMRLYQVVDPDAANCDVILGEPDFVHRGLGPLMSSQIKASIPRVTPGRARAGDRRTTCGLGQNGFAAGG